MGSRTILKIVKSSRTGTPPCVRAIWGVWELPPPVPALLEVVVDLARLPLLLHLAVLAPLQLEGELAPEEVQVAEVSVQALNSTFSSAMAGNFPSAGTPRSSPVPRSGRKVKRRL